MARLPGHVGTRTEQAGQQARHGQVGIKRFPVQPISAAEDLHPGELLVRGMLESFP